MSIDWSTLDSESQTPPLPMVRLKKDVDGRMIELLPRPALSPDLSLIEKMCPRVAQRLTQVTPLASTTDQLWQRVEAAWSDVPQEHMQSLFESMPKRVKAVIYNNGGYSGY
ncbi:transposable element Tcb1 transposase [Trichonephila clavipes]|nr:transposable element Tcb1 transposase [Trichonephila clavipes]